MRGFLWAIATIAVAGMALADLQTGFEPSDYSGDADGEKLTGQQGWSVPAGTDYYVFTHADDKYGFVDNPAGGGKQFIAGTPTDASTFARAQHDVDFSAGGEWVARYDLAAQWQGSGTSAQNLGSFSLQNSTTARSWIALNRWVDPLEPEKWNAGYNVYDSAGVALATQEPGSAWQNLSLNNWYRQETKWSFTENRITEVSITDLHTGVKTTVKPEGWYLLGGKNPTQPLPTAVRFFAGGLPGNIMAWDNTLIPEPSTAMLIGLAALAFIRRR